jgi:hypothetical protein
MKDEKKELEKDRQRKRQTKKKTEKKGKKKETTSSVSLGSLINHVAVRQNQRILC